MVFPVVHSRMFCEDRLIDQYVNKNGPWESRIARGCLVSKTQFIYWLAFTSNGVKNHNWSCCCYD